jgi:hypothetical protein
MSNPTKMIFGAFFRLEKKATPSWFGIPSTWPNLSSQFYRHFFVIFFKMFSKRLSHTFLDINMVFDWYLYSFLARKSVLVVHYFLVEKRRSRRSFFFEVQGQMTSEYDCSLVNTRMYNV